MSRWTEALAVASCLLTAGCSNLVVPSGRAPWSQAGTTRQVSAGDTLYYDFNCPCREAFRITHNVDIHDFKPLPAGTVWFESYTDKANGQRYLMAASPEENLRTLGDADWAIAIDEHNQLPPDGAVVQFRGARAGRKWRLNNPEDTSAIKSLGPRPVDLAPYWTLEYIGPAVSDPKTLRFTIVDHGEGGSREQKGQIEYAHSLSTGSEFVIRGVRIKIDDVAPDGIMTFTILSDGKS